MTDERWAKNRTLAVALGYKVERSGCVIKFSNGGEVVGYKLLAPDGSEVVNYDDYYGDLAGYTDEAKAWRHAPDFYGSLDATDATMPVDGTPYDIAFLDLVPGEVMAEISHLDPFTDTLKRWEGGGATRAWAFADARASMAGVKTQARQP